MKFESIRLVVAVFVAALLITVPVSAQVGTIVAGPVDVDTATGNNGALGVAYANGTVFVSSRGVGAAPPHLVYRFDLAGNLLGQFQQDPATSASAWGYRDGASDNLVTSLGVETAPPTALLFGCEQGLFVIDPTTGALVTQIQTANGMQVLASNPILGAGYAALGNIYRAVAYDPNGNGGNGSFWSASFASDIVECDLQGNILTQHVFATVPGAQWSIYGLAWDHMTQTLWANSAPNVGEIREIDPLTGQETGNLFSRSQSLGLQGGLEVVYGDPFGVSSAAQLIEFTQGTPDEYTLHRLNLYATMPQNTEVKLVTRVTPATGAPTPLDPRKKFMRPGDVLEWGFDMTNNPGLAGSACVVLANIDWATVGVMDASQTAVTLGGVLPELDSLSLLSTPPAAAPIVMGDGLGLGNLFGAPFLIGPNTQSTATTVFPVPPGVFDTDGDKLRLEAIVVNPGSPLQLVATNMIEFETLQGNIIVEAVGGNTFNAATSSGFWRVRHVNPAFTQTIVDVTFDLSTQPVAGMVFDVDQIQMADEFWGGNSALAGTCSGTYRNGSDVACGLIYDNLTTFNPSTTPAGCDPAANCGFIATLPSTTTNSFGAVQFRFIPGIFGAGLTFEFDADTDAGAGISGGAMAGTTVTITLADTSVLVGQLAADPSDPARSVVVF